MPSVSRDGAAIYFETSMPIGVLDASPPWVTLINGHTRTSTDFRPMTRYLNDKGFAVLTFDNRGCGKTVVGGPVSGASMVEDVAALWDECGITTSAVLGISMGGMIAQHLIAQYQSRVWAGILVSTTSDKRHVISSRTPWVPEVTHIKGKLERFFSPAFVQRNGHLIEAMAKNTLKAMEGGRFQQGVDQQVGAMESFTDPRIETIRIPILILHGELDIVVVPAAVEDFRRRIANAEIHMYPDVGHLLLAEAPKILYRDVGEFLLAKRSVLA